MSKFSKQKTALIIGRWQPWHKGHRELFKAALDRAERVAIGVRHTFATDGKNPFSEFFYVIFLYLIVSFNISWFAVS